MKAHIRGMIRRDLEQVFLIEKASFSQHWNEEDFLQRLRQRNCIGTVAEIGEKVVGYMIYELHKGFLNLINFAVHPNYRKQRIGTQLVNKLKEKLSVNQRTKIVLLVDERNLVGQQFFASCGYKATGSIEGYFGQEPNESDAYEMEYALKQDEEKEWEKLLGETYNPINRISQYLERGE